MPSYQSLRIHGPRSSLSFPTQIQVARDVLALYPGPWKQYLGFSPQSERLAEIAGQALVKCNARIFSTGYNDSYSYMSEYVDTTPPNNLIRLPLCHGQDCAYTFFDDDPPKGMDKTIAVNWQNYLMGFVLAGNPDLLDPIREMKTYGEEANVMRFAAAVLNRDKARIVPDPLAGVNCDDDWPRIWDGYGETYIDDGGGW